MSDNNAANYKLNEFQKNKNDEEIITQTVNLKSQIRTLSAQITLIQDEWLDAKRTNLKLEEKILDIRKQKFEIEEQLKLGSFGKEEKEPDLNQMNSILSNAMFRFTESQNSFKDAISKLIESSPDTHNKVLQACHEFIDDKSWVLFDILKELKSDDNTVDKENSCYTAYEHQIQWYQQKIDELKKENETVQKELESFTPEEETKLINELTQWEEQNKKDEKENEKLKQDNDDLNSQLSVLKIDKEKLEAKLAEALNFINHNCNESFVEDFFIKFKTKF